MKFGQLSFGNGHREFFEATPKWVRRMRMQLGGDEKMTRVKMGEKDEDAT